MDVLEKARDTIRRHGLVDRGERVLLACSGGADSTCLMNVMQALAPEGAWDLAVAHFNHRLRRDAEKAARALFDRFDADGDGMLRRREVPEAFFIFAVLRYDTNGDEILTPAEAVEAKLKELRRKR